jgi:hypothetical protein
MSDVSDIVDAVLVEVASAVSGVTTSKEVVQPDTRPAEDFPFAMVVQTEYDTEPLPWLQENRIWTISGALWQADGTRDTMETKLEAIRDEIFGNPTLSGACDQASCVVLVPESHPDDRLIAGLFVVRAEQVA